MHIANLSSNFRFYKKIIETFKHVKDMTQAYNNLDDDTIGNMLMYVTVICIHDMIEMPLETAPTKSQLYDFLYGTELWQTGRDKLKHIGSAFRGEQWYGLVEFPQIYNLLRYGEFDYKIFAESHTTTNSSELEKFVLKLEPLLKYRTHELRALIKKIDSLAANTEEGVFTSLERMKCVFDRYAVLCGLLEIELEKNPVNWMQCEIEKFINSHEVSLEIFSNAMLDGIILSSIPGEDELFAKNKKIINGMFERALLSYWVKQLKEIGDIETMIVSILQDERAYITQLFLYIFINDTNMHTQIFDLRDTDYMKWQEIVRYLRVALKDYDENYGFIRYIRNLLGDTRNSKELFYSSLTVNVKALESADGAGLSERYTARNLMPVK